MIFLLESSCFPDSTDDSHLLAIGRHDLRRPIATYVYVRIELMKYDTGEVNALRQLS
jgi:hypothetical protein